PFPLSAFGFALNGHLLIPTAVRRNASLATFPPRRRREAITPASLSVKPALASRGSGRRAEIATTHHATYARAFVRFHRRFPVVRARAGYRQMRTRKVGSRLRQPLCHQ